MKDIGHSIIKIISLLGDCKVATLHTYLSEKQNINISLVQLYNIIKALLEEHILVKQGTYISLNTSRLIKMQDLIDQAHISKNKNIIDLGTKTTHIKLYANNLYDLDTIWTDAYYQLLKKQDHITDLYLYNAKPYYAITMTKTEKLFFSGLKERYNTIFLIGDDSLLSQDTRNIFIDEFGITQTLCCPIPEFFDEGYMVNVVGEYIIECFIPEVLVSCFRPYFSLNKTIHEVNKSQYHDILLLKHNVSLLVTHNKERAESINNILIKNMKKQRIKKQREIS